MGYTNLDVPAGSFRLILRYPPPKPAIFFVELFMAARHMAGYY